ncbi:MAG: ferredoxin [Candidatus Diapherotrites archaeon]|nr:ferredoxin [Candidatus Diapherotrites archaeon]
MAKIEFDREACIGCKACTAVSSNWVEDKDKVKPLKTKISGKEVQENKEAESVCPVQAIKVIE